MDSHKISDKNIELSYKHAEQIAAEGKRLERIGSSLSENQHFTPQEIECVQKAAQQIQERAKAMFEHLRVASSDAERSTPAFTSAAQEHAEAIRLHAGINRILVNRALKLD